MEIEIRPYLASDAPVLTAIFYRAVESLADDCYTPEQVRAWAPLPIDSAKWQSRLDQDQPWVAVIGSRPVGFISLLPDGLIGLAFVDPEYQHRGVGSRLCDMVEQEARARGVKTLYVEASHAAKPLFERLGYAVIERNLKRIGRSTLINWRMQKSIPPT